MRHSNGALATLSVFFTANSRRLRVTSASPPTAKVAVASARPMMVRNWRCQPYDSLLRGSVVRMRHGAVRGLHRVRVGDEVCEGVGERAQADALRVGSVMKCTRRCRAKTHMKQRRGASRRRFESLSRVTLGHSEAVERWGGRREREGGWNDTTRNETTTRRLPLSCSWRPDVFLHHPFTLDLRLRLRQQLRTVAEEAEHRRRIDPMSRQACITP